jgi:hypothetical protein
MPRAVMPLMALAVAASIVSEHGGTLADAPNVAPVVRAALGVVRVDSLCRPAACVVVVDTAIHGASRSGDLDVDDLPVVVRIPASTLQSLARPGVRVVAGRFRYGPLPHEYFEDVRNADGGTVHLIVHRAAI